MTVSTSPNSNPNPDTKPNPDPKPNASPNPSPSPSPDLRAGEHFMRTAAEPWMRWAYFTINPSVGAARADIWRYAVLHHCGGVYLDLDSTLIGSLREWLDHSTAAISCEANTVSEFDLHMARRLNLSTDGLVGGKCVRAQWLLASPARHPLMRKVRNEPTTLALALG